MYVCSCIFQPRVLGAERSLSSGHIICVQPRIWVAMTDLNLEHALITTLSHHLCPPVLQVPSMSVSVLNQSDFHEWSNIWAQYLATNNTTLPAEQHQNTFSRILANDGDINAIIIRDEATNEILGLSHFVLQPSVWTQNKICHLSGMYISWKRVLTAFTDQVFPSSFLVISSKSFSHHVSVFARSICCRVGKTQGIWKDVDYGYGGVG